MKNLTSYTGNTTDFLEKVIQSKKNSTKDPCYKERIVQLKQPLAPLYGNYDNQFNGKNLTNLSPHNNFSKENETDLVKMYSYKSKPFILLKKEVTTTSNNRLLNTCQNCTISEVSSLDHFLPKQEFPEFAVHPYNLIPSCTKCNGHKSTAWKANNKTLFINLYTDILPQEQYLFVKNINVSEDSIEVAFEVRNDNNIDIDTFNLIKTHYERLKLCERFALNNSNIISEFVNTVKNYPSSCSKSDIIQSVIENIQDNKKDQGFNHYKWILQEALIHNQDFLNLYL